MNMVRFADGPLAGTPFHQQQPATTICSCVRGRKSHWASRDMDSRVAVMLRRAERGGFPTTKAENSGSGSATTNSSSTGRMTGVIYVRSSRERYFAIRIFISDLPRHGLSLARRTSASAIRMRVRCLTLGARPHFHPRTIIFGSLAFSAQSRPLDS